MASAGDLYFSFANFNLKMNNIKTYNANYEYIAISNDDNQIFIYSINTNNLLYSHTFSKIIVDFQFHPNYYNIISVSFFDSSVFLCHINTKEKKIEEKVEYMGCSKDTIYKTIFSSFGDGNYLASLFSNYIRIWNMNSHYDIYSINIDDASRRLKTKWSQSGTFLIYPKDFSRIEVFSLKSQSIEYYFDEDEDDDDFNIHDFYLIENSNEISILFIKDTYIILKNLSNKVKILAKINQLTFGNI